MDGRGKEEIWKNGWDEIDPWWKGIFMMKVRGEKRNDVMRFRACCPFRL